MATPLTPHEKEVLRELRDGKAILLSPKEHLRLLRRSLIHGAIDKPHLTVVGGELAADLERKHLPPSKH